MKGINNRTKAIQDILEKSDIDTQNHIDINDILKGINILSDAKEDEQFLNMQYYMEYCELNGYTTPQEWLVLYKHF